MVSLASVFKANLQSSSRTQASIAHSPAESELYAMTQAVVESLAINSLAILSSSVSIVIRQIHQQENQWLQDWALHAVQSTSGSSIFGFRKESKEGKLELKKVGIHFNLSDVLTKNVPGSALRGGLGQHLPRLNIFKVNSKRSAAKQVQYSSHPQPLFTSSSTPATLSVFMFSFNNDDAREELRLRFRQASRNIERIFTPPRRGSRDQGDSSVQSS